MNFLDYLTDNRGLFIDHRATPPTRPGMTAQEAEAALDGETTSGGGPATTRRRRRARNTPPSARFRHVRPAFSPSPYSDPLPYEEPWERAFR